MDEKFVRKFLKGSLASTLGTVATIAVHFMSISIMSRYADELSLGLYFLMTAVATAAKILSSLGMDMTLVHFLSSDDEDKKKQAFAAVMWSRMLAILGIAVLMYFAGGVILNQFDANLVEYRWYLVVLFTLLSIRELFFYILQGLHQFGHYAGIQAISAIIKLALVFSMRDSLSLTTLLMTDFACFGASIVLLLWVTPIKRLSPPRFMFKKSIIPDLFRYGLPLYTNSVLTHISDFGGTYIVGILLSPIAVAAYGIAGKIPDGFRRLFMAFHSVYYPLLSSLFAKRDLRGAGIFLNKCLSLLAVGAFAATLFALLFSRELVLLVFSDIWLEIQPTFVVIMFAVCLQLLANTMSYSLVSAGQPGYSTRTNMLAMGSELGLSLVFVPVFGYIGIGFSYLVMCLVSIVSCYFYLLKAGVVIDLPIFIRPFLILAGTSLMYGIFGYSTALWLRILIFVVYIVLSFVFIPDCRQAVSYFWNMAYTRTVRAESA